MAKSRKVAKLFILDIHMDPTYVSGLSITVFNTLPKKIVQMRSFFWFLFSCIRTEYGDLRSKSPYSVRIQEITDQKKLRIWTFFTLWKCKDIVTRQSYVFICIYTVWMDWKKYTYKFAWFFSWEIFAYIEAFCKC